MTVVKLATTAPVGERERKLVKQVIQDEIIYNN